MRRSPIRSSLSWLRGKQGSFVIDEFAFLGFARRSDPQPPFRSGEATRCTCCGASQWIVGRQSAECGACGSPAALATPSTTTHLTAKPKG
jgi:hypothetical protein